MRYQYLSHLMGPEIPVHGGQAPLNIVAVRSIAGGSTSNMYQFTIGSHYGTHIDAPNHFFEDGEKISGYPADFWVFRKPIAIDVALEPSELLKIGRWIEAIGAETDAVLFRSGWARYRREKRYSIENPGIHPEAALRLRNDYPGLRAVGIDWMSVSPFTDRQVGRETHRVLLDPKAGKRPICIIEDMDLSCDMSGLREVIALPVRIETIDSSPCTVLGGFGDKSDSL